MKWFKEKTSLLKNDNAKPAIKLYNNVSKKLVFYEILFHDAWMRQCAAIHDALEAPLLTLRGNIRQELVLNFDPFFKQVIEETDILRKMGLEIPEIAQVVYEKQEKLLTVYENMKFLLDRFLKLKVRVPQELVGLLRPVMKKVEKAFMPGSNSVTWTSTKLDSYFEFIEKHLNEFEQLLQDAKNLSIVRISQYLYDVSHAMLVDFPEDRPMTLDEFMDRIRTYGQVVSKELEYRSRLIETAVIELINMMLTTAEFHFEEDFVLNWLHPMPNPEVVPKGNDDKILSAYVDAYPKKILVLSQ